MDQGLFVIGILILIIGYLVYRNRKLTEALAAYTGKDTHKKTILNALADGPLSNEQLRDLVGVSARSVVSYMDELEAEGKVEQVGTTGTAVIYQRTK